jgi:hypothetical protein
MTTVPAEDMAVPPGKYCQVCGCPEALESYRLCDVCIWIWSEEAP